MYIYIHMYKCNHIYHNRTSMIFTTNSYGFRTLQDAVSTSTITYHISSRGRLENIWRCYFKDAGSACANPRFFQGTSICIQSKDCSIFQSRYAIWILWRRSLVPMHMSIFPFAICTCSPQIGTVRADIPSINRAEGRNNNSYVKWSNKTFFSTHCYRLTSNTSASFSSFEISFQCLVLGFDWKWKIRGWDC